MSVPMQFTPPEVVQWQNWIKYALYIGLGIAALYAFVGIAPTAVSAVVFIREIMQNTMLAVLYGAGAIAAWKTFNSLFSQDGWLNRLVIQNTARWVVMKWIELDPLAPFDMQIAATRRDQKEFDENYQKMDGVIASIEQACDDSMKEAKNAARIGDQAQKAGNTDAYDLNLHTYSAKKQEAEEYAAMAAQLIPTRAALDNVRRACALTAGKLEIDRGILAKKWKLQKNINAVHTSASRLLGRTKTETWALAMEAKSFIDNRYAEEFGQLAHLKRQTQPFIDSVDLNAKSYSAEMAAEINQSSAALSAAINSKPTPALTHEPAMVLPGTTQKSAVSNFLK